MASPAEIQKLPPGNMLLLIGPPGVGKSTFCRKMVLDRLAEEKPVIFVTTEYAPSDVVRFLREKGLDEVPPGLLHFVDAFHETVGLSTAARPDIISSSCGDLTSIELAISRQQNKIQEENITLVFDSLTSPYLLNGQKIIRFLRLSLAKFAAEGNSVLLCIDEGCGKKEDIGAMMSIANGIIKMKAEHGATVLDIVKHPVVKPTTIKLTETGVTPTPPPTIDSLESLNEKIDWIVRRLDSLEAVLTESQKYPEVVDFLGSLRIGTSLYGEPLKTLARLISTRRLVESTPERDEITRIILNAMALRGPQNISQLTREVHYQRGKSSRITVRNRLKKLLERKVVVKEGNYYRLAE